MTIIKDLHPEYMEQYQSSADDTIQFVANYLNADKFTTLEGLIIEVRTLVSDKLMLVTSIKEKENSYSAIPFTYELIEDYNKNGQHCKDKNVSGYIHKALLRLKPSNIGTSQEYQKNKMTSKEVAKLLGKYDAIRDVYRMLYDVKADGIEDPEVYIEKLKAVEGKLLPTTTLAEGVIEKDAENPDSIIIPKEYHYLRIFKNFQCYSFFQRLQEDVRPKCELADYSFIYRKMQKDGFINEFVSDAEFRTFLAKLDITIDRTKLLEYCITDYKVRNYYSIKDQFQQL